MHTNFFTLALWQLIRSVLMVIRHFMNAMKLNQLCLTKFLYVCFLLISLILLSLIWYGLFDAVIPGYLSLYIQT